MAKELNLDQMTCNRMNSSSADEAGISAQVAAIDNLVGELSNVLDVVQSELKRKGWAMKTTRTSSNCLRDEKCRVNGGLAAAEVRNRTERSNTYPKVNGSETKPVRTHLNSKQAKIIKNILIG